MWYGRGRETEKKTEREWFRSCGWGRSEEMREGGSGLRWWGSWLLDQFQHKKLALHFLGSTADMTLLLKAQVSQPWECECGRPSSPPHLLHGSMTWGWLLFLCLCISMPKAGAGPAPLQDSTIETTMLAEVQVSRPPNCEHGSTVPIFICLIAACVGEWWPRPRPPTPGTGGKQAPRAQELESGSCTLRGQHNKPNPIGGGVGEPVWK